MPVPTAVRRARWWRHVASGRRASHRTPPAHGRSIAKRVRNLVDHVILQCRQRTFARWRIGIFSDRQRRRRKPLERRQRTTPSAEILGGERLAHDLAQVIVDLARIHRLHRVVVAVLEQRLPRTCSGDDKRDASRSSPVIREEPKRTRAEARLLFLSFKTTDVASTVPTAQRPPLPASPGIARSTRCHAALTASLAWSHASWEVPFVRS